MDELELIKQLTGEHPPPRPAARAAARAALVEFFESTTKAAARPPRRRVGRTLRLAFAGTTLAVVAAMFVVLGGSGPGGRPALAEGAELKHLAKLAPHMQLAGRWQVTSTSIGRESGVSHLRAEERLVTHQGKKAVIRWSTRSLGQLGRQLRRQGLRPAGTVPTETFDPRRVRTRDYRHMNTMGRAKAYISARDDRGFFRVVGLWSRGRWSFELSGRADGLDGLERLLERLVVLGWDEWLVAIRPGGAKWLNDTLNGDVRKIESFKVERPDGSADYVTELYGALLHPQREGLATAVPVLRHEGDHVTISFKRAPPPNPRLDTER